LPPLLSAGTIANVAATATTAPVPSAVIANIQKTPSDGNRSTVIFCKFVYSYSG
jgi:hypothetical protein